MQRPERKDFGSSRSVVTVPRPTIPKNPFPYSAAMAQEAFAERIAKEEAAKPRYVPGERDGLLEWCAENVRTGRKPVTARELVEGWYYHWRGVTPKPPKMSKKFMTHHVDRASHWLERQLRRGHVVVTDSHGKWGTKRYKRAAGEKIRRLVVQ